MRALKQLEEMFTSVQVNRFLFRVKEQPQENTIVAQKTVQSKRICLLFEIRIKQCVTDNLS